MPSSIVATKLPDGRDMMVISGNVFVNLGGCSFPNGTDTPQTGQSEDPGLVGIEITENESRIVWKQQVLVGPNWFQLDPKKDVVPMVSLANISTGEISEYDTYFQTGFGVVRCQVELQDSRIKLVVFVAVNVSCAIEEDWDLDPADHVIRLSYNVTAVGKTDSKYVPEPPVYRECTNKLSIKNISASSNRAGFPASFAIDGNTNDGSRWIADHKGDWIRADLGTLMRICRVEILWWQEPLIPRHYKYSIETSLNGINFDQKLSGASTGNTSNFEKYMIPTTDARYVRITIDGSDVNESAQIRELQLYGFK